MEAGPQGIKVARRRSRMRRRDLWTWSRVKHSASTSYLRSCTTHFSGISLSLDDVQDADIAARFTRRGRDHAILWLQKSSHDVEDSGFPDGLGLFDIIARKRGVGGHEEVASWGWDECCDDAHEVIVHITGVAESCRAGRHDG